MILLRLVYTYRNPKNEDYLKALTEFYRQAMDGKIIPIGGSTPTTAPSFAIFGNSGVGKSTVVERTLSFLPQVLLHEEHKLVQVVWMKLDCPPDGSLKQLLSAMIVEFGNLTGIPYEKILNKRLGIDELILEVAKIAAMHHLGLLVIDEVQNLLVASGVGPAIMLNFFLTFANVVKIPLVTVGTIMALHLLKRQFRTARRVGDHGMDIWDRFSFGTEWTFFVDGLWKYQWTAQPVPMSSTFSKLMYDKTQGIHALVIRLFQMAQLQAIRDESEILSVELIDKVAFDRFKLVTPMLDFFRGGDKKGKKSPGKLVEDLFDNSLKTLKTEVDNEAKLSFLQEKAHAKSQISAESSRAVSALIALGYEEDSVQKIVAGIFEAHPDMTSSTVVRTILETMKGNARINDEPEGESLKEIVQKGEASGINAHSALKAAGVISSP
jgi:hypothetical protein